jgi:branched-chain amino acid transport system substrate-binding protein
MQRNRTKVGTAVVVTLGLALVGCRGAEDEDGSDVTSVAEAEVESEETSAAEVQAEATTADAATTPPVVSSETTTAGTEGTTAGPGGSEGTTAGSAGEASGEAISVECPDSEPGLSDTEMTLGGTYPLSGPVAAYASIPKGIEAYFSHLNETEGGITDASGVTRQINWSYLDDQYTPNKTLENVRNLVENEGVWLVFNPLGTPGNTAIRDYMNEAEVPQLYVATGASKWGNEHDQYPWTIGYQPDYESEGIAYAQYILDQNPDANIGIVYANDDFGKDYLNGLKEGLEGLDAGDQLTTEVTYETTDATIDSQVSQVLDSGVDAFVLIATPAFAIQGINATQARGFEGTKVLTSVSSSVGAVMGQVNEGAAEGWVTSVYIKDPSAAEFAEDPAMVEMKEILLQYVPDANTDDGFYVYGFSVAQAFQATIEQLETVCRAGVMASAENLNWEDPPLLLDGIGLKTGEGDAFPIQQVQLEKWEGDGWVIFGEIIDAASASD